MIKIAVRELADKEDEQVTLRKGKRVYRGRIWYVPFTEGGDRIVSVYVPSHGPEPVKPGDRITFEKRKKEYEVV